MEESHIRNFYKEQTVFITGVTGSIGKVLVEKLLRTCPEINKIFVLIRTKKGHTAQHRLDKLFEEACYGPLKSQRPDFKDQVVAISGDCLEPNLGLSEENVDLLAKEVTIVIHSAAVIKFYSHLKELTYSNIRALKDLTAICKRMKNLKSLVYISTAYSRAEVPYLEEKFFEPPIAAEKLIELVDNATEKEIEAMTPRLVGKCPNNYTFTKGVGEDLFRREAADLPAAVIRLGIVSPAIVEPVPGWCDNILGFNGLLAGMFLGFITNVLWDKDCVINAYPSDYAVNTILSVAWNTHHERTTGKKPKLRIFNGIGCNYHLYKYGLFSSHIKEFLADYPCNNMQLYPRLFLTKSPTVHKISLFVLVGIPSYFADLASKLQGKKARAMKAYDVFRKITEVTSYFSLHTWQFETRNVNKLWAKMLPEDQKLFNFNLENIDWRHVCHTSMHGARRYLCKDPPETVPQALKKRRKMFVVQHGAFLLILYLLYSFLSYLYCSVFK